LEAPSPLDTEVNPMSSYSKCVIAGYLALAAVILLLAVAR
jgi:hypothetical protein